MKSDTNLCTKSAVLFLGIIGATLQAGETAANPAGTWKSPAAKTDSRTPTMTLTLKLDGTALTGSLIRNGETNAITNGAFKGDEVSFQTVRPGKDGANSTTYTWIAKLTGDSLKGKVEIGTGRRTVSSGWEVERVKE